MKLRHFSHCDAACKHVERAVHEVLDSEAEIGPKQTQIHDAATYDIIICGV